MLIYRAGKRYVAIELLINELWKKHGFSLVIFSFVVEFFCQQLAISFRDTIFNIANGLLGGLSKLSQRHSSSVGELGMLFFDRLRYRRICRRF